MNAGDHALDWQPDNEPSALRLWLTPERAVYWPEERTLFVADLHIGKAAVFRARGIPVPMGTTTATLQRLSGVIERTGARRLVVLGDFLHAKESQAASTMAALQRWRERHAALSAMVVLGNHDRHAGTAEASLGFDVQTGPFTSPMLVGVHEAHEAGATPRGTLVLAGHVHPVACIRGRLDRLRLPCYWLHEGVLTLPAFGDFTGGHEISAAQGRRFIVGPHVKPI